MRQRTTKSTPKPSRFQKQHHIVVNGRHVEKGTEVTCKGHGRQRFIALVTNTATGDQWIDTWDLRYAIHRSLPADSITTVHRTTKGR